MYWDLSFLRVFLCTIVFSLIIVKSLQLRECRQIAEPRKYCLVRVIVFFFACVFFIFFLFLTSWEFGLIPYKRWLDIGLRQKYRHHHQFSSRVMGPS